MSVINVGLLSHPLNWITVALWLFIIGLVAVHIVPMKSSSSTAISTTQG